MKAEISEKGEIEITPETPIEVYALNEIVKKWDSKDAILECLLIHSKIKNEK